MNLRHLEVLEAIWQTGSFTGAAKKLHLTQSAVSYAVAELERQTGTPLFDRLPRGVRITACGKVLLSEARGILASCRSLDERMGRLGEYTPVSFASSITIASFWLPRLIGRIQKEIPQLPVNVKVVSAANALKELEAGEVDMAFLEGMKAQGPYRTIILGAYELGAACAPDFMPEKEQLSLEALCHLPLLLREPGSAARDVLDHALATVHQKAYPIWESVNSGALMEAAAAGLGITVLPVILMKDALEEGKLRKICLKGAALESKMMAVYHREKYLTHGLEAVLRYIEEESDGTAGYCR